MAAGTAVSRSSAPTTGHAIAVWTATIVCLPSIMAPAQSAAAQTARLEEDAGRIIEALAARGIADREDLFEALETARDSNRSVEYGMLRALGISMSDAEFDASWQSQPARPGYFDLYDLEQWTTDVLRSWAKVRPREAFTWLYATRHEFGYSLPVRQCFQRVTADWARTNGAAAEEAEWEALALTDPKLRDEAITGLMSGNILRGDGRRIDALMEELKDEELRAQVERLMERYF